MNEFQGQVAIISGGTSGIGLATAKALSARGVRCVLIGKNAEKGAQAARSVEGSRFVACDITDRAAVQALVNGLQPQFKEARFLVNAAGVFAPKAFVDHDAQDYDRYLDISR